MTVLWFLFTTLLVGQENPRLSQPIRVKNLPPTFFPRLLPVTCMNFEFWFAPCERLCAFVLIDYDDGFSFCLMAIFLSIIADINLTPHMHEFARLTLVYGVWKFLLLLTLAFFLLGNARSNTGANTSLLAILSSSQRHNQQRRCWYWTIYIGDTVVKVSKWIIIAETITSRWSGNEPMMSGLSRAAEIEPDSSYLKL